MEYTILILLLPFLSFLALGIGGKWMSHRTAGTIGTLVLAAVTVLSYVTVSTLLLGTPSGRRNVCHTHSL